MPQLDAIVCDHIENRLLQPERLEEILASILGSVEIHRVAIRAAAA